MTIYGVFYKLVIYTVYINNLLVLSDSNYKQKFFYIRYSINFVELSRNIYEGKSN